MHRFLRILAYISCLVSILLVIARLQNTDNLSITYYEYVSEKVDSTYSGFKILQISDVHNHGVKYANADIVEEIKKIEPDMVVFTGDLVDSHTDNLENIKQISAICSDFTDKLYFVTGNHEAKCGENIRSNLYEVLDSYNIKRYEKTENAYCEVLPGINLMSVQDPSFTGNDFWYLARNEGDVKQQLENVKDKVIADDLNILIGHRPELFDIYANYGFDLCFSGHTHGNQIGIPNFKLALSQLDFRGYVYGNYSLGSSTLFVSAGLGYSWSMPFRINRNAELVVVTLRSK